MLEIAKGFMEYFRGLDRAYGTYNISKANQSGKLVGKAITIQSPVTLQLWLDHLTGKEGLGIVPIQDDSTCFFGAIDIDVYQGLDIVGIIKKIHEMKLPLVPCLSKSGGLHCFCFVAEPIPASLMRAKLSMFAAALGFGNSEVFPKQDQVLADRGDIGNWINMPYFNTEKVSKRVALGPDGAPLTVVQFFEEITRLRYTEEQFKAVVIESVSDFADGPPCLQYLVKQGFGEGTRNDGLFNICGYLKKAFPDSWEGKVEDYNQKYLLPPLMSTEVASVVKSFKHKQYSYACKKPPVNAYCNRQLCRTRKFGIGSISGMPQLTGITKYNSNPPVWFLDVDGGGRMEMSTEDIQNQIRFQRRCIECLNIMPAKVKDADWTTVMQSVLENVLVIEAPADATPQGTLVTHLEKFCIGRAAARDIGEVLMGKPWTDVGKHYFRMSDFTAYLERQHYRDLKTHQICAYLKSQGAEHETKKIKGKCVNLWVIRAFDNQSEGFEVKEAGKGIF